MGLLAMRGADADMLTADVSVDYLPRLPEGAHGWQIDVLR